MLVKSSMALLKLCLILVCTNSSAQSWETPYHNPYRGNDVFNFAWAIGKILETRMGEVDRGYHTRAVYHALNNAVEGQDVEWFNDSMGSQGRARIVWTHPSPGGWCRRVHSLVYFNRHSMTYEDTACYNTQTNSWNFIAK